MRRHLVVAAIPLLVLAGGCGGDEGEADSSATPESSGETRDGVFAADSFAVSMRDAGDQERPHLEAAKPFLDAVAARDHAAAFAALSPWARKDVRPDQFVPPLDDTTGTTVAPLPALTADAYAGSMQFAELQICVPFRLDHVGVTSIDSAELSGGDPLDRMITIGGMPESVPPGIRAASIRARFTCKLSEEQAGELSARSGVAVDQLMTEHPPVNAAYSSLDWPYLNLKAVLVRDADGVERIGYFEFLPASMLD